MPPSIGCGWRPNNIGSKDTSILFESNHTSISISREFSFHNRLGICTILCDANFLYQLASVCCQKQSTLKQSCTRSSVIAANPRDATFNNNKVITMKGRNSGLTILLPALPTFLGPPPSFIPRSLPPFLLFIPSFPPLSPPPKWPILCRVGR